MERCGGPGRPSTGWSACTACRVAVGVAGYVLGGGIGWLTRRHGFASSHVRAFEVITAVGEARQVDPTSDAELFWALCGGGGGPAIVTSFELELFELREAFAGGLMWSIEKAETVVNAWREWTATVPNDLTSTIKLLRFPPLPTIDENLRGRAMVAITLVFAGDSARGTELAAPLRAAATPIMDTLGTVSGADLADIAGDPTSPTPALGHAALLDQIGRDESDAFLELAGPGVDTPLVSVEIRHLGGALRDCDPDPGCAGKLDSEGLLYSTAPVSPQTEDALLTAQREVAERTAPFSGARDTILTFDEQRPMGSAFAPGVVDRLAEIVRARDPDGLLVSNHAAD